MGLAAERLYQKLKRSIAAFGLVVRTSARSVLASDPTITAGSGAPSEAEPNGSTYMRTNGVDYKRVGGAWVANLGGDAGLASLAAADAAAGLPYASAADTYAMLALAANKGVYATAAGAMATYDLSAYGRGLGGVADEAAFKALVNLEPGTDVQAYSAVLAALALGSVDHFVRATCAGADGTGGTNTALVSVQLYRLDGTTPIASARQVMLFASSSQYSQTAPAPNVSLTLGTVTAGAIIATISAGCWLVETDATGLFGCTATNTDDETAYWSVTTPAAGVSDTSKACVVVGSNSDSSAWSA